MEEETDTFKNTLEAMLAEVGLTPAAAATVMDGISEPLAELVTSLDGFLSFESEIGLEVLSRKDYLEDKKPAQYTDAGRELSYLTELVDKVTKSGPEVYKA